MADKVYPSAKPGVTLPTTTANLPVKPQLYNRAPRPVPKRYRRERSRVSCCCCCIWTTIVILSAILIAGIAGCVVYVLYRPKEPAFSVSSLRVATLNVTSSPDASSSHLRALFNMSMTIKNPNEHMVFSYMPFVVTAVSENGGVQVGNGTIEGMVMDAKNATTVRVMLSASQELDAESASSLRSELGKRKGLSLKILVDTDVKVMVEKIKSKMVSIRVTCVGIKGVLVPPKVKPSKKQEALPLVVADVAGAKCQVDLRIKIWKFTFTF